MNAINLHSMETILQYGIATAYDHMELAGYVNDQIAEGWQPYGNVFQTQQREVLFIHQPMVFYLKKKNSLK